jgi:hypothetical protein
VQPLLTCLGWGTGSNQIIKEDPISLSTKTGEADYVLYDGSREALGIEVKRLGEDVGSGSKHTKQLIDYLIGKDLWYGILTNGATWYLFKRSGYEPKQKVWEFDLLSGDVESHAEKLLDIEPERFFELDMRIELNRRREVSIQESWNELIKDKNMQITAIALHLKREIETGDKEVGVSLPDVEEFINRLYQNCTSIFVRPRNEEVDEESEEEDTEKKKFRRYYSEMIIGGEKKILGKRKSKGVLVETAEWLIRQGKLHYDAVPIKTKGSWFLVATEPVHRNGRDFFSSKVLSNGLYLETCFSLEVYLDQAHVLLKHFEYDIDEILQVKVEEY